MTTQWNEWNKQLLLSLFIGVYGYGISIKLRQKPISAQHKSRRLSIRFAKRKIWKWWNTTANHPIFPPSNPTDTNRFHVNTRAHHTAPDTNRTYFICTSRTLSHSWPYNSLSVSSTESYIFNLNNFVGFVNIKGIFRLRRTIFCMRSFDGSDSRCHRRLQAATTPMPCSHNSFTAIYYLFRVINSESSIFYGRERTLCVSISMPLLFFRGNERMRSNVARIGI